MPGAPLFKDSLGQEWQADQNSVTGPWGYVGGTAKASTTAVNGTVDDLLYRQYRESLTEYKFTVPNGQYNVQLRFAEFAATAAGKRVMKITLEGGVVENALDVYAQAGKATALNRSYTVTVSDGVLNIGFVKVTGNPMVSAIEVKPAVPPTPTPTFTPTITPGGPTLTPTNTPTPTATPVPYTMRVNVGGPPSPLFKDSLGQEWQADQNSVTSPWGYVGGTAKASTTAVNGTVDDLLYQQYRESLTEYKFTVPNGQYNVQLRFAEFAATAAGKRVMKITLEGAVVESALDVYALAGKATALNRSYTVIVSDGVLNIGFVKVTGNPMVSAIEVK